MMKMTSNLLNYWQLLFDAFAFALKVLSLALFQKGLSESLIN